MWRPSAPEVEAAARSDDGAQSGELRPVPSCGSARCSTACPSRDAWRPHPWRARVVGSPQDRLVPRGGCGRRILPPLRRPSEGDAEHRSGGEALVRVIGEGQACAWPGIFADAAYLATATALEGEPRARLDPPRPRGSLRAVPGPDASGSARARAPDARAAGPLPRAGDGTRAAASRAHAPARGAAGRASLRRRHASRRSGSRGATSPSSPAPPIFTVSRLLGQWEKAGVLTAHRERIVVGDPMALSSLVDRRPRLHR